ncbi:hypothetical protein HRG_001994 [Hirsutella rhossiliensis]|uniref:NACHT domain-containing protein n=1 Tax=Hirsutella rhossiliensis TaxID=111463 RepID=A0A9P8N463_9HYPO|nr:uncharacterized protein HRG_01994 [Hirsutella rhossiliensis]KAH0966585.1 hypothetical protein HRG_01994 [Hirsutella rhossiliensis]
MVLGMINGLEIVSLIDVSIDIIKLISELHDAIKSFEGLPKAFQHVNEQLPLVLDTLTRAKERVPQLEATTRVFVKEKLQQCEKKASELLEIFKYLKETQGNSIMNVYKRVVKTIGKRGRVEDLMKDILSSVKELSENQVFQLAGQVDKLQNALDTLAQVIPSLADSEMESMNGGTNPEQFGDNNVQNWSVGDGDAWNVTGVVNRGQNFNQSNHYGNMINTTVAKDPWAWLLDNLSFKDWLKPGFWKKVFWLFGEPGFGKSALCVHAIEASEKLFRDRSSRSDPAAFYFYDYGEEPENDTTVYLNLADSLFRQKYAFGDQVSDKIFAFAGSRATGPLLKEFIKAIIEELQVAYIFLDGLDEVLHDSLRANRALQTLNFCLSLTEQKEFDVKVWCSSQDRVKIRTAIEKYNAGFWLHLTGEENAPDIEILVRTSAEQMQKDGPDGMKLRHLHEVMHTIKGNFLWASLAVDSIVQAGPNYLYTSFY